MFGQKHIQETFQKLKEQNKPALMPYLTLGYPDLSLDCVEAAVRGGADLLELGMPFSDPLADGPTIQHSTQVALQNGMNTALCLEKVRVLRSKGIKIPICLMGYCNPILNYGLEKFVFDAKQAGVDGFIIPDFPLEEAAYFAQLCRNSGLALVFLISPNTSAERAQQLAENSGGFLYLVSVTGVTGVRAELAQGLETLISNTRKFSDLPLAVGFGITTPQQAKTVGQMADGVIVGSALIRIIDQNPNGAADAVYQFTSQLSDALQPD